MKKLILSSLFLLVVLNNISFSQKNGLDISKYNNPKIEKQIDSILAVLTIDEKIGQLMQISSGYWFENNGICKVPDSQKDRVRKGTLGSFLNVFGADLTKEIQKIAVEESRAKIPILFGLDVIHGFKTTFPIPLAESCTWDSEMAELSSHIQAVEAFSAGIHWTFNPMVDVARDPRWGRISEGAGEDTYLGSIIGAARVRGYQKGDVNGNFGIAACPKHFAAYGAAEGGRDYNTVDISETTLRNVYLPPFKAAKDAGALTYMASFNEIEGMPSSGNHHLLTDILRTEWGFKGFVVSDWNSVGELITHGVAADGKEAAVRAINAGLDMEMESDNYIKNLKGLVESGQVKLSVLDEAVRRILRVKFVLGLFENPYKYCNTEFEKKNVLSKENLAAALKVSERSIVLLKNDNQTLPLTEKTKKIAVIGKLAASKYDMLGNWEQLGDSNKVATVLSGLKAKIGTKAEIKYAYGCGTNDSSKVGFAEAIKLAKESDVVILAIGEEGHMSGEARGRASIELPGVQEELANQLFETGKPVVVLLMSGRPVAIPNIAKKATSLLETWFLGLTAGDAIANVLVGDYNPSGKLTTTFPYRSGSVPAYYNHKNTGRPEDPANNYSSKYTDIPRSFVFPFGYGLSYTTFGYSDVKLSTSELTATNKIAVSVEVSNTGNYDGEEVVQLYIRDLVGSITRPVKELKGFKKIFLKKGEKQLVEFLISKDDLLYYSPGMGYHVEPGAFELFVGTNSENVKKASFNLK